MIAGAARRKALEEADKRYLWHPFTPMQDWVAGTPLVIERAEGVELIDVDGRRYLDGVSSLWVNVHGHRHPALDGALRAQLDRMAHSTLLGLTHPPAIELARRLVEIAPAGLARVFYADAGAAAVEIALKIAFQYWHHLGRPRRTFACLAEAYHGDTIGAMAVGRVERFHAPFAPLLAPTCQAPTPARAGLAASLEAIERLFAERAHEIAAFIVEPLVQAAGGMLLQPPGFLRRLRELCTAHDVLLVADEVATGFGRTGRMFACEHEAVTPDLLVVGKGLTGGYLPLAATLTTARIYEAFLGRPEELKTFFHGHTYTGNPLACAVALASLDLFERDRVLEALQPKIAALARWLAPLADHPHVGEVRQCGFMVGIELVEDRARGRPYPPSARTGARVSERCRDYGVVIRPLGDVVVLMPPLAMAPADLQRLVDAARRAIDDVTLGARTT
jgi:adenosylmethionine-8-amino-7-oxononanoate aminotransferase